MRAEQRSRGVWMIDVMARAVKVALREEDNSSAESSSVASFPLQPVPDPAT